MVTQTKGIWMNLNIEELRQEYRKLTTLYEASLRIKHADRRKYMVADKSYSEFCKKLRKLITSNTKVSEDLYKKLSQGNEYDRMFATEVLVLLHEYLCTKQQLTGKAAIIAVERWILVLTDKSAKVRPHAQAALDYLIDFLETLPLNTASEGFINNLKKLLK